jgi:hypothetical protein
MVGTAGPSSSPADESPVSAPETHTNPNINNVVVFSLKGYSLPLGKWHGGDTLDSQKIKKQICFCLNQMNGFNTEKIFEEAKSDHADFDISDLDFSEEKADAKVGRLSAGG